jgi:tRNA-dihydrouridine synthase 2
MLAAEYGAGITYGEEIIDHKFLKCERVTNGILVHLIFGILI